MNINLWHRLLDGSLHVDPERYGLLQSNMNPKAIDLLRNLKRLNADCRDFKALGEAIANCESPEKIPPYVWYMAEKGVPHFRDEIHDAMLRADITRRTLPGYTAVLIDMCHSMLKDEPYSGGINAIEVAASWAVALKSDKKRIFTASGVLQEVMVMPGLGGIDRILISQVPKGCHVAESTAHLCNFDKFDRVVVFTNKRLPHIVNTPCYIHTVTEPGFYLFNIDRDERNYSALHSLKKGSTLH